MADDHAANEIPKNGTKTEAPEHGRRHHGNGHETKDFNKRGIGMHGQKKSIE